jgi:hypothetical protein
MWVEREYATASCVQLSGFSAKELGSYHKVQKVPSRGKGKPVHESDGLSPLNFKFWSLGASVLFSQQAIVEYF